MALSSVRKQAASFGTACGDWLNTALHNLHISIATPELNVGRSHCVFLAPRSVIKACAGLLCIRALRTISLVAGMPA